eukprot:jgi/Undpi1/12254/HiC_scaffold_5.g01930.m1
MSEEDAQKALDVSYERFGSAGVDLSAALSTVDNMLDCIDMGVRSMKALGSSGRIYHCLVNKTPDEVAKLHGSKLAEWQVAMFKGIIELFGNSDEDQLRLRDLEVLAESYKSVNGEMVRSFAEQLVEDFWLARPQSSSGYRLGIRTYVELPELLKAADLVVPQDAGAGLPELLKAPDLVVPQAEYQRGLNGDEGREVVFGRGKASERRGPMPAARTTPN